MSCRANAGAAIAVDRTAAAVKSFRFIRRLLVVTPGQRLAMEDVARFHAVPPQTDVRFLFRCWKPRRVVTRREGPHRAWHSSPAKACLHGYAGQHSPRLHTSDSSPCACGMTDFNDDRCT